jgi:hypothetical protein
MVRLAGPLRVEGLGCRALDGAAVLRRRQAPIRSRIFDRASASMFERSSSISACRSAAIRRKRDRGPRRTRGSRRPERNPSRKAAWTSRSRTRPRADAVSRIFRRHLRARFPKTSWKSPSALRRRREATRHWWIASGSCDPRTASRLRCIAARRGRIMSGTRRRRNSSPSSRFKVAALPLGCPAPLSDLRSRFRHRARSAPWGRPRERTFGNRRPSRGVRVGTTPLGRPP